MISLVTQLDNPRPKCLASQYIVPYKNVILNSCHVLYPWLLVATDILCTISLQSHVVSQEPTLP